MSDLSEELAGLVKYVHGRGWSEGTGGNYSAVIQSDPLRLLITPSGVDKGQVCRDDFLIVDQSGAKIKGEGAPSAETLLHVSLVTTMGARVVLHSHSVNQTLASLSGGDSFQLSNLEMLKGLSGVKTHMHTESVPILDNSQHIPELAKELEARLVQDPKIHGVLLRGHGLYTWGCDMFEAKRHLEVLEFLFEVTLKAASMGLTNGSPPRP